MGNSDQIHHENISCYVPDRYDVDSGDIIAIIYPDGQSEVLCGYAVRREAEGESVIACSLKERDNFSERFRNNTSCGYNVRRYSRY